MPWYASTILRNVPYYEFHLSRFLNAGVVTSLQQVLHALMPSCCNKLNSLGLLNRLSVTNSINKGAGTRQESAKPVQLVVLRRGSKAKTKEEGKIEAEGL